MIDWEELEHVLNAAPQANSLAGPPLGPSSIATTAIATPAVAAPAQDMAENALQAPQSDLRPESVGETVSGASKAVEHWRRNLERFQPGHIGHEYAKAAIEALGRRYHKPLDEEGISGLNLAATYIRV